MYYWKYDVNKSLVCIHSIISVLYEIITSQQGRVQNWLLSLSKYNLHCVMT